MLRKRRLLRSVSRASSITSDNRKAFLPHQIKVSVILRRGANLAFFLGIGIEIAGLTVLKKFEAMKCQRNILNFQPYATVESCHHRNFLMFQLPQEYEFLKPSTKLGMQIAGQR